MTELDNFVDIKRLAVSAMTGHVPCTPDSLYSLGKALEAVCEKIESIEIEADTLKATEEELRGSQDEVDSLKCKLARLKKELDAV